MKLYLYISVKYLLKHNWRIMAISDHWSADELKLQIQEPITELEKVNQTLKIEILKYKGDDNKLIKLKDKLEAEIRNASILHTLITRYTESIDSRIPIQIDKFSDLVDDDIPALPTNSHSMTHVVNPMYAAYLLTSLSTRERNLRQ